MPAIATVTAASARDPDVDALLRTAAAAAAAVSDPGPAGGLYVPLGSCVSLPGPPGLLVRGDSAFDELHGLLPCPLPCHDTGNCWDL